jgi:hypothetical protein
MEQETLLTILKILIETAKDAGGLFLVLPWPVQIFIGFVTVMIGGTICFRVWVFWHRLKALRYGRIQW